MLLINIVGLPHFHVLTTNSCFGIKFPLTSKRSIVVKSGKNNSLIVMPRKCHTYSACIGQG